MERLGSMLTHQHVTTSTAGVTTATAMNGPALRMAVAVSVALAAFSVAVHFVIMRQFEALGVFAQYNVLFDADPNARLGVISHSWPSGETIHPMLLNSVHPYFSYYFGPLIRILAKCLTFVGATGQSEPALRVALGVLVMPIVSGLQTGVLCVVLFVLGYRPHQVALIATLGIVSFSGLIFGSIPEHFALTNLAVTVLLLFAAAVVRGGRTIRLWHWSVVGAFATGITITNIVIFGIIHGCTELVRRRKFWPVTAKTVLVCLSVFAVVIATALAIAKLHQLNEAPPSSDGGFVSSFLDVERPSLWDELDRAATALGNAVAPTYPETKQDPLVTNARIGFVFTLKTSPSIFSAAAPLGLLTFLGMVFGGLSMIVRGGHHRSFALISIAVLGFNIVFHSFWGTEHFLYSQHWITPALILLTGVLFGTRLREPMVSGLLGLYVIAVAASNLSIVVRMVDQIAAAG